MNLTRIYTRTGDTGTTSLGDMTRTSKTDPRLVAYADVDETNSHLGVSLTLPGGTDALRATLQRVQNELFDVGADLSTPVVEDPPHPPLRVTQEYIDRLEKECDSFNAALDPLRSFILPGGTPLAAQLHVARTVCRRAERSVWVAWHAHGESMNILPATYLNRLSDLLFILARVANPDGEVLWVPGGER